ncbi:MAG: hypothetical protein IM638_03845 [Bacteroidetes bacterium]|nr:hypothetical protein [Bacteroidota bacterium]
MKKTAEDIYQAIALNSGEDVIINNCTVSERLDFYSIHKLENKRIYFVGVTFENEIIFNSSTTINQVIFENCRFIKYIVFFNVTTRKTSNAHGPSIQFISKCSIVGTLLFEMGCNINRGVLINDCQINNLKISNTEIESGNYEISKCEINSFDSFGRNVFAQITKFVHNKFFCNFYSTTNYFNYLLFANNEVYGDLYFESSGSKKVIFTENPSLKKMVTICNYPYNNANIEISRNTVLEQIKILLEKNNSVEPSLNVLSLLIDSNIVSKNISVDAIGNESIPNLSEIRLRYSNGSMGEISLNNLHVDQLFFSGLVNSNCITTINNIHVRSMNISKFTNKGVLQFYHCSVLKDENNTLAITDTVLGDTQFRNFNIDKFDSVIMLGTDLSTITISPIPYKPISAEKFIPKLTSLNLKGYLINLYNNQLEDSYDVNILKQERDIFRQLKLVCEKAGDRSGALYYKSHEMRTLHRELIRTKRFYNADRILLALSRTNSYGQDYRWPILWAVVFTVCFYFIIFTGISYKHEFIQNSKPWWGSAAFSCDNFPLIFKMLNPVYDLTRFGELEIKSWVWPFEYLHKLTLAFFIFQTISAFRKFVK